MSLPNALPSLGLSQGVPKSCLTTGIVSIAPRGTCGRRPRLTLIMSGLAHSTSLLSQRPTQAAHRLDRAQARGPSWRLLAAVWGRNGRSDPVGCLRAACHRSAAVAGLPRPLSRCPLQPVYLGAVAAAASLLASRSVRRLSGLPEGAGAAVCGVGWVWERGGSRWSDLNGRRV